MANGHLLHSFLPLFMVVGLALLVKAWFGRRPSGPTLDVRPAPLMTPMERRTLALIEEPLPWARIHAQVSMGAILKPQNGLNRSQAMSVRNRFSSKRVDYVVEDRQTGRVVLLIELDDRYHRADLDARRDRMMAAAGYAAAPARVGNSEPRKCAASHPARLR